MLVQNSQSVSSAFLSFPSTHTHTAENFSSQTVEIPVQDALLPALISCLPSSAEFIEGVSQFSVKGDKEQKLRCKCSHTVTSL